MKLFRLHVVADLAQVYKHFAVRIRWMCILLDRWLEVGLYEG